MFKVFNRCLTTRTLGHNQKKINILRLFHVVVNRTNVDYAALLWWDFNNCVFQKKDVIQYPRLKKLIIAYLMKKHPSISPRLEEDSIKDNISLVSIYTTGNVTVRGMLISDAFLTKEIRATDDYKEYETLFVNVVVPMNQPQLIVSTQKTHRTTPRAHRTTPSDDRERDEIPEVTFLSLALHKTTLAAEVQETVAKVQEKLEKEEIEKMIEGKEDEESYARKQDEKKDDDAEKTDDAAVEKDNDDHTDHTLVGTHATGSMETRNEQMQTPITTPTRSPRKDLSSDKTISKELTAKVSPITATTSKDYSKLKSKRGYSSNKTKILPRSIVGMGRRRAIISPTTAITSKDSSTTKRKKRSFSHKTKTLPGSIVGMCKRRGQIRSHIKNKFITHEFFMSKIREVLDHCNKVIPEITFAKTNEMIKEEMPRLVKLAVDKDREVTPINVSELISKEFATHGPIMIEELFRKHMQNTTLNLYPTTSSSTAQKSSADLQQQLYLNMKIKPQDQAADPELWEILKAKFEKP
ncbi:hypothetical protein Tco_0836060 [Tanacetum coccineum]